jgi:hypothetical protein
VTWVPPSPAGPSFTPAGSPTQRAQAALQQVKEQCQQANPTCYYEKSWWWVDPLYGLDPDMIASMEKQSLQAYQKQGLQLDQIVAQNKNNPLKIHSKDLPAREYSYVIFFLTRNKMSPIMSKFLNELNLNGYDEANYEPLFLLGHIEKDPRVLYESAQWCTVISCYWVVP